MNLAQMQYPTWYLLDLFCLNIYLPWTACWWNLHHKDSLWTVAEQLYTFNKVYFGLRGSFNIFFWDLAGRCVKKIDRFYIQIHMHARLVIGIYSL